MLKNFLNLLQQHYSVAKVSMPQRILKRYLLVHSNYTIKTLFTFRSPLPLPPPPPHKKRNALSLVKEITTSCTVDTLVF